MPVSVRLDEETKEILDRIARAKKVPRSEVIRRGIRLVARQEGIGSDRLQPTKELEHLIGSVSGGAPDLSERTGTKFREILSSRNKNRR